MLSKLLIPELNYAATLLQMKATTSMKWFRSMWSHPNILVEVKETAYLHVSAKSKLIMHTNRSSKFFMQYLFLLSIARIFNSFYLLPVKHKENTFWNHSGHKDHLHLHVKYQYIWVLTS